MIYFFYANFLLVLFTSIGALFAFFKKMNKKYNDLIFSFSIGIVFSSVFCSLIIESFNKTSNSLINAISIIITILFALLLCKKINISKKTNIIFSMYIHNIPEGILVGLMFSFYNSSLINLNSFMLFTIGISIQNIIDGASLSLILKQMNYKNKFAFLISLLSGFVEPIFAFLFYFLFKKIVYINFILPLIGGICLFIIVKDLFSEIKFDDNNSVSFNIGLIFMLMIEYFFK